MRRGGATGLRRWATLLGVLAVAVVGAPAEARAATVLSVSPALPGTLTVNQRSVSAALNIANVSTGAEASLNTTLNQITLVPSCGSTSGSGGDCAVGAFEPDVLALSTAGTGRAGTACAGISFSIAVTDSTQDKYSLTPSASVVLAPPGGPSASCIIDFTVDVLKSPVGDVSPGTPGAQSAAVGFASGTASNMVAGAGRGVTTYTVARGAVPLAASTSPSSLLLGSTFTTTATLSPPALAPAATGTVTFMVYGPNDSPCAGVPNTSPAVGVAANSASSSNQPTAPGSYRVTASYSGDANYLPTSTSCANPSTVATVSKASPSASVSVSPSTITVGSSFTATATLSPLPSGIPAPTGTITFNVFGPNDAACSGAPSHTSTRPVTGASTASDPIVPASAGTYRVTVAYSGDANYAAAGPTACMDPAGQVTVNAVAATATPTPTATATATSTATATPTATATATSTATTTPTPTATANPTTTATPTPTTPVATPTPTPTTSPTPTAVRARQVIVMPPAQRCAKRRSLVIRFKEPTAITLIAASVKVDDKPALAVPEGRLPGRYRLRRLPKREVFAVKVAASLADGRRLQRSRFYRSCRPRPKR